jgi:hypothetical protein
MELACTHSYTKWNWPARTVIQNGTGLHAQFWQVTKSATLNIGAFAKAAADG